jgi:acyl carrier protein
MQIRQFIVENFLFGDDQTMVTDEESLMDHGVMDSTGVLEVLMFLEENFGVTISDEELTPANFDSVAGMSRLIDSKQKGSEAAS